MRWSNLAVAFALAGLFVVGAPVWAQEKKGDTHEGTVASVTANKLMMKDKAGKEHAHETTADTSVSCDGKPCKLTDLKAGMKIRVTTKPGDMKTATKIEALDKNKEFPPSAR